MFFVWLLYKTITMAAGDRTKRLVAEIRDILSMNDITKLLKNDYLLYNYLTKHQYNFMAEKRASKRFFEITLDSATTEYTLNPRLFSIVNFEDGENNTGTYVGCYKEKDHIVVINTEATAITTGDKIIVSGFIKPLYDYNNGLEGDRQLLINDRIRANYDPIIENDYDHLLVEAVLSEFRHVNKLFKDEDSVYDKVETLSLRLASQKRFAATKCTE